MAYKQFLTPEQIKKIVSGAREEVVTLSVDLSLPEIKAFCLLLKGSRGFEDADGSFINYPKFEKYYGLENTRLIMEAMGSVELVFCAAAEGMTIDEYITEYDDE